MHLFKFSKYNAHISLEIFGIKMRFKNPLIDHLSDCCFTPDLDKYKEGGVHFIHPIGIVIVKGPQIGKDCKIFQNVTIGKWKRKVPKLGNNVTVFPHCVIIGDVEIGDNCVIGAGSVVTKSIPANKVAIGNPAKVIKDIEGQPDYWIKFDRVKKDKED